MYLQAHQDQVGFHVLSVESRVSTALARLVFRSHLERQPGPLAGRNFIRPVASLIQLRSAQTQQGQPVPTAKFKLHFQRGLPLGLV